jgi:hypothetical protein
MIIRYLDEKLKSEIEKVTSLMSKLSTLKGSGRLRKYTNLRPVKRNETRWLGVIEMLDRYLKIHHFLPDMVIDDPEVETLILNRRELNNIQTHQIMLQNLKDVTLYLQNKTLTLNEAQAVLDEVILTFQEDRNTDIFFDFSPFLSTNATIVHSHHFEKAVIKIQQQDERKLSILEKKAVEDLKVFSNESEELEEKLTITQKAVKKQKLQNSFKSKYVNLR